MTRRVYVAGKVTGLPKEQVKTKFNQITNKLHSLGYQVVKPVAITDEAPNWDDAMRNDIKKMLECDELHMLPDWQESRGAQLERDIAIRLGMNVVYH
jgi:hypothetical protein